MVGFVHRLEGLVDRDELVLSLDLDGLETLEGVLCLAPVKRRLITKNLD